MPVNVQHHARLNTAQAFDVENEWKLIRCALSWSRWFRNRCNGDDTRLSTGSPDENSVSDSGPTCFVLYSPREVRELAQSCIDIIDLRVGLKNPPLRGIGSYRRSLF